MKKACKIRIYPTKKQENLINIHFGHTRHVYNWALEFKKAHYEKYSKNLSIYEIKKQLTQIRKNEKTWLLDVSYDSLANSLFNLDDAFKRFFKYKTGYPKFKSKYDSKQSFQVCNNNKIDIDNRKLYIAMFREGIRFRGLKKIEGTIKTVTISKHAGKYFAALSLDVPGEFPEKPPVEPEKTLGIDVGISSYCALSTGEKINNPKFNDGKLDKRLRFLQRRLSRRTKGSRRWKITKNQIAKLHYKISCQRKDFLHKLSHELTNGNGFTTIGVENLNIQGMMKNKKLARSIADASWYSFYSMLQYKCDWYGKNFVKIGRFDPSSKKCQYCGYINKGLKLSHRSWTCPKCGTLHDRDVNAALNIKDFASNKTPESIRDVSHGASFKKTGVEMRKVNHAKTEDYKKLSVAM